MSINGVATLSPEALPSVLPPFTVQEIRKRVSMVQAVMREVMKENTHYGTIPGTPKPSLWKAGAEVLCLVFRLAPLLKSHVAHDDADIEWVYHQIKRDRVSEGTTVGYFEVEACCTIQSIEGQILSRCSARCSNREAKYRMLGLFEVRNTVQKMAEKRAFVSAVLMATGASDIFTQDLEDIPEQLEATVAIEVKPQLQSLQEVMKPATVLSSKRKAWLHRAALEAQVGECVLVRCMDYLSSVSSKDVSAFFDDLARRKAEAFKPFLAMAS